MRTLLTTVSLLFFLDASALAKVYYLDTKGLDKNDGSTSKPWKTFASALTKILPGDTLEVRAGTYKEQVKVASTGLSTDPIVIRAAAGAAVIIDGGGTIPASIDDGLVHVTGSYITVDGLEVKASKGPGAYVSGVQNTITRCKIHDNAKMGITFDTASGGSASDNDVYKNVMGNKAHTATSWDNGVEVYSSNNVKITGNKIYNNHGEGLALSRGKGNTARGNTIYDNYSDNLFINNTDSATVDRNFIYSTANSGFEMGGQRPSGVAIGDTDYGAGAKGANNVITNNILVGNSSNIIWFATSAAGTGFKTSVIANNTMVQATSQGFNISKGAHTGSAITNNIVIQSIGQLTYIVDATGITFSNNNWLGGAPGKAAGKGDVLSNCKLADITKLSPAGFKISSTSPCKDKGAAVAKVTTDYFGTKRPAGAAYDIGAHEFTTAVTPDGGLPDGAPAADKGPAADGPSAKSEAGAQADGAGQSDAKGTGGDASGGDGEDDGCGCRVGSDRAAHLPLLLLLVLLLAGMRLRRR